jgi:hypothetical protein
MILLGALGVQFHGSRELSWWVLVLPEGLSQNNRFDRRAFVV